MQERINRRKALTGVVVSDKSSKTIVVAVDTFKKDPLYQKRFKSTKKFAAHDEKEEAQMGDIVKIVGTRPLSKTKFFRLEKIRQRAKEGKGSE
ncbi:30S ribosomal protein S17 [[Mycoplasma] mobile]|uniref:Small ribosomal subunit protein uS17 n=1 Tax=Mycoplasma mobile (strain ATCC 43663 / 163K / NCTC 11711) TaxID=267748 RepID=RS17_MYCM1|nr:30S ribosomal protein S17 [[Mycoplasma] mobile]Q6KI46.1 RecName: Full=Small ribosomal subunit protein uS17; AltName: Full=30S ribosomal protein S17 [Mycoplasma mobile 163K]AAT27730.1 30S ribosomal protein s17 [Mycoplasma mobile 163K]